MQPDRLEALSRSGYTVRAYKITPGAPDVKPPAPIELSEDQRGQILARIAEFRGDRAAIPEPARGAVAAAEALPLLFDWSAVLALRLDGQVVWIPYDGEAEDERVVEDEDLRDLGLFRGSRLHPGLPFLVPTRPTDAVDCPDCRGSGRPTPPRGMTALPENVACSCGGRGWRRLLPHRARSPLANRRRALISLAVVSIAAALPTSRTASGPIRVALRIDPNTAPEGVLESLPRIGPAMAHKIIAARGEVPFADLDDFDRRVPGVGPVTREALRPHLRFDSDGGPRAQPKDR